MGEPTMVGRNVISDAVVSSLVDVAAAKLRIIVLETPEDEFIGSEEELLDKLNVSRPTFRLAARLLVSEQLLVIRRGAGGGYFARRPSADAIVHMASIYLSSKQAGLKEMFEVGVVLLQQAASKAAHNPSNAERLKLKNFLQDNAIEVKKENVLLLNQLFLDATFVVGEVSGNPVLTMFLNIIGGISVVHRAGRTMTINKAQEYLTLYWQLAEHISQGDAAFAEIVGGRLSTTAKEWYNIA